MNFETYLMDKFAEDCGCHKDDFQEHFERWLSELDGEDYIEYGNEYGESLTRINKEGVYISVSYWDGDSQKFDSCEEARRCFYSFDEKDKPEMQLVFGWNGDSQLLLTYN